MNIIGRKDEMALLEKCIRSKKPEFLAVYGRRRVGKTFLIKEYFKNNFAFYMTGSANTTMRGQLENFHDALLEYGSDELDAIEGWPVAFRRLKKLLMKDTSEQKKVVFIDELPWLDTPKSGFVPALEYFWNSWASSRPDIFLVICGSATSWMIRNVIHNHGGLYNRITKQMHIKPFTLAECEMFFQNAGVVLSRYSIAETYMIFGGIPYYLDLFDESLSLPQNVDRLLFADNAVLANEFQDLYASLFKHFEQHILISEALYTKRSGLTRDEIIKETGLAAGGTFTRLLEELEQCGFLRKYRDFTKPKNGYYYQLTDFFTIFHLTFIRNYAGKDQQFWSNYHTKGGHNAWSGLSFERVCMAHIDQIKMALGISGVSTEVTSWRSKRSKPGTQIDLIIDRNDDIINLCEVKYSGKEYEIDRAYDDRLRRRRSIFAEETATSKALHQTMVTTYGVSASAYKEAVQSQVTLDDLFHI
jgi:AAA+ ATPase superfamily predicted ATPase